MFDTNEEFWESKYALLGVRGTSILLGLVRVVATIRLVSVHDYALIGIVEAWRLSIVSLTSLGIAESVVREGAAASDSSRVGQYLATAYWWGLILSALGALLLGIVALQVLVVGHDPRLFRLLLLAMMVSLFERNLSYANSALRAILKIRLFALAQIFQAGLLLVLTVGLTYAFNVEGYYNALWLCNLITWLVLQGVVAREVPMPRMRETWRQFKSASSHLWGVSWYIYWYKSIASALDRGPLLVASALLPQQTIGFITIALEFGRRLTVVNQALFVTTVARLSRAFAKATDTFPVAARNEMRELAAFNLAALIAILAAFLLGGNYLLGHERFINALLPFLVFLPAQLLTALVGVVLYAVLVPMRSLHRGALWASAGSVLVGLAVTYAMARQESAELRVLSVSAGMVVGSVGNFIAMFRCARRGLRSHEAAVDAATSELQP